MGVLTNPKRRSPSTKIVTDRAKPPAAGKGRPKGARNKTTTALKEMILKALDAAGGVVYLTEQARETPSAFMALLAKVLPMQVTGEDGGAMKMVHRIELVPVESDHGDAA